VANTFKLSGGFFAGLKALGIDPAAVLRDTALPLSLGAGAHNLVTTEQFFALWRSAEKLSGDATLGLKLAHAAPVDRRHPGNIAAYHARTFREALQRFGRYKVLCCHEELRLRETKGEASLEFAWVLSRQPAPGLLLDACFLSALDLGRRGTEKPLHALRVEFTRAAAHRQAYEAAFGCAIKFRAARDAVIFAPADLDLPFVSYNEELLAMLTPALDRELTERRAISSTTEQAKWVIRRLLGGPRPEIREVAKELGVSDRTLQRRITEEGTSFRAILSHARRELAHDYLEQRTLSVGEIAYLLSYEDQSSFFRAFQEWEGVPPGEWRGLLRPPLISK